MPLSKFESFLTNTKLDIEVGSQKAKKYARVFEAILDHVFNI